MDYQLVCRTCQSPGDYMLPVSISSPKYCGKCHSECENCSGPSQSDCTLCPSGKLLFSEAKRCYTTCPSNISTTESGTPPYCQQLSCSVTGCILCSFNSSYCYKCSEDSYLKAGACVADCGDSYFIAEIEVEGKWTRQCVACPAHCRECAGSQECLACNPGYTLDDDMNCTPCGGGCQDCKSGAPTRCSSCSPTQGYFDARTDSCISCLLASQGEAQDTNNRVCSYIAGCSARDALSLKCLNCEGGLCLDSSANTCDSCLAEGIARAPNLDEFLSIRCPSGCRNCSYAFPNYCHSCLPGYFFTPSNSRCSVDCSAVGWYPIYNHADRRMECRECHSDCLTCFGNLQTECTACKPGKFYSPGQNCQTCPIGCSTCTSAAICTSCQSGGEYLLLEADSVCSPWPSAGLMISIEDPAKCIYESSKCIAETPDGVCSKCQANYYLLEPANTCTKCLLEGYVIDSSTGRCRKCGGNCKTCQPSNTASCITCMDGFYMLGTSCVLCNQPNQIRSRTDCFNCDPTCLTCFGRLDSNCAACPSGKHLTTTNKCIDCRDGYFVRGLDCLACATQCRTCSGPFSEECEECISGFHLDSSTRNCIVCNTNAGYYIDKTFCRVCDPSCATCRGQSASDCLSCDTAAGMYLLQSGQCGACSSPGQSVYQGRCFTCDESCASCRGATARDCLTCAAGRLLYPDQSCGPCTEDGWYQAADKCLKCHDTCLRCTGPTGQDCTACLSGSRLELGKCKPLGTKPLELTGSKFRASSLAAVFTFNGMIDIPAHLKPQTIAVYEVLGSSRQPVARVGDTSSGRQLQQGQDSLRKVGSVHKVHAKNEKLTVELLLDRDLDDSTLLIELPEVGAVRSRTPAASPYPEKQLSIGGITSRSTPLDKTLMQIKAPGQMSFSASTASMLAVSSTQAFLFMKLLQTIDFFVYLNVAIPPNFSLFIQMITSTIIDVIPNAFDPLVGEDLESVKEKFGEYGVQVHFFSNLGQLFTTIIGVAVLKSFMAAAGYMLRKSCKKKQPNLVEKTAGKLNWEFFYGMIESSHLDVLLAIMVYFRERHRLHMSQLMMFTTTSVVSVVALMMISLYIFMLFTVRKLFEREAHKPEEDSPKSNNAGLDESAATLPAPKKTRIERIIDSCSFWIEDKQANHIFQRHFSLVLLFKDICFAVLLYALYYHPLALIIILSAIQVVFTVMVIKLQPFKEKDQNRQLIITHLLYIVMDGFFIALILLPDDASHYSIRYYVLGFGLIAVVLLLLAVGFYYSIKSMCVAMKEMCAKIRDKFRRSKSSDLAVSDVSQLSKDKMTGMLEESIDLKNGRPNQIHPILDSSASSPICSNPMKFIPKSNLVQNDTKSLEAHQAKDPRMRFGKRLPSHSSKVTGMQPILSSKHS